VKIKLYMLKCIIIKQTNIMKRFNNYLKLTAMSLAIGMMIWSCDDSETVVDAPLAYFTFTVDGDNPLLITFANETLRGDSFAWDFGDGSGTSTDENPTYPYAEAGTYTVSLTATNAGGTHTSSVEITVLSADPVNIIVNGEFNDDSAWTIQQFNANNNGSVTIADGVVVFNEIVDIAEGGWGEAWAHAGIYQAVTVEVGTYKVDMDVITEGINEAWAETWIGATAPEADEEYDGEDGATRAAMINSWDCGGTATYTGLLSEAGCLDGTITFAEAGTVYFVIRSGGFTFGPNGITVDNITMFKQP
jgi:PKD repeat protein